MFIRFLLFAIFTSASVFASEPRLRISMTVRTVSTSDGKEERKAIVSSPIATVESGRTTQVDVGTIPVILLPSLEGENNVLLMASWNKHSPGTEDHTVTQTTTIKLGEKGFLRLWIYEVEFTPSLVDVGINIDFPGGPLDQLVAQLTEGGKKPFNLVGDNAYLKTPVPPFKVRNASPVDFAQALNFLLTAQDLTISATGNDEHFQPIFFIKSKRNEHPPTEFICYNLTPYLEGAAVPPGSSNRTKKYTGEEIVKTLTDACEFQRGVASPDDLRFRFNPETKLLFISGRPELVHTAGVTLEALPKPIALY